MGYDVKKKVCASCGTEFKPTGCAQKFCEECRQAMANEKRVKKASYATRKEVVARNRRQVEYIKSLKEEIAQLRARVVAPAAAMSKELAAKDKAIERQREMVGEFQRVASMASLKNIAMKNAIKEAIRILTESLGGAS